MAFNVYLYLKQFNIQVISVVSTNPNKVVVNIDKPVLSILSLNQKFKSTNKHNSKKHGVLFVTNHNNKILVTYYVGKPTGVLTLIKSKNV